MQSPQALRDLEAMQTRRYEKRRRRRLSSTASANPDKQPPDSRTWGPRRALRHRRGRGHRGQGGEPLGIPSSRWWTQTARTSGRYVITGRRRAARVRLVASASPTHHRGSSSRRRAPTRTSGARLRPSHGTKATGTSGRPRPPRSRRSATRRASQNVTTWSGRALDREQLACPATRIGRTARTRQRRRPRAGRHRRPRPRRDRRGGCGRHRAARLARAGERRGVGRRRPVRRRERTSFQASDNGERSPFESG